MKLRLFSRLALMMGVALAVAPPPLVADPASGQRQSFDIDEGLNLNSFLREGPVAVHLLLRSGTDPRILIAFPAGNSGVGLWFSHGAQPVSWTLIGRPQPVTIKDERGRSLYGMTAEANVTGAAALSIKQAVLSSVRVLRDYQAQGTFPAEVAEKPRLQALPNDGAAGATARNSLTFLSYREKFLAGSWRFNTYFGRDTLMSVRLLMPVLAPEAVEAGLGAVLTRLSAQGEVAHEEDIGEFAVLDHLRATGVKS